MPAPCRQRVIALAETSTASTSASLDRRSIWVPRSRKPTAVNLLGRHALSATVRLLRPHCAPSRSGQPYLLGKIGAQVDRTVPFVRRRPVGIRTHEAFARRFSRPAAINHSATSPRSLIVPRSGLASAHPAVPTGRSGAQVVDHPDIGVVVLTADPSRDRSRPQPQRAAPRSRRYPGTATPRPLPANLTTDSGNVSSTLLCAAARPPHGRTWTGSSQVER